MRRFVLVRATVTPLGRPPATVSGVRKLKRGVTLDEFVAAYAAEVGISYPGDATRFDRDGTVVLCQDEAAGAITWNFTEYAEPALLTAVSHLTREELLRDLPELLPLSAPAR